MVLPVWLRLSGTPDNNIMHNVIRINHPVQQSLAHIRDENGMVMSSQICTTLADSPRDKAIGRFAWPALTWVHWARTSKCSTM